MGFFFRKITLLIPQFHLVIHQNDAIRITSDQRWSRLKRAFNRAVQLNNLFIYFSEKFPIGIVKKIPQQELHHVNQFAFTMEVSLHPVSQHRWLLESLKLQNNFHVIYQCSVWEKVVEQCSWTKVLGRAVCKRKVFSMWKCCVKTNSSDTCKGRTQ